MHDEFSVSVARELGALQADMRTVKHDVVQVSTKIDALSNQIANVTTQQARGFGFFAGVGFVIISVGSLIIAAIKLFTPG